MLTHRTVTATGYLDARADEVFAALTDVERLAEWNEKIARVVRTPGLLEPGAEWVVEMHVLGMRFQSSSKVRVFDPNARLFVYRSTPEDNPSFSIWSWEVDPEGDGSRVRVKAELHPLSPAARWFFTYVRAFMLRRFELKRSLRALERRAREGRAAKLASAPSGASAGGGD